MSDKTYFGSGEKRRATMAKKVAASKATFLLAMEKTFGNITQAAKASKIDRSTPFRWEEEDEEFKAAFRDRNYKEMFKDMIESNLAHLAINKDRTVLIFLAKTQCKDRGYVERQEFEHRGNMVIDVVEVMDEKNNGKSKG